MSGQVGPGLNADIGALITEFCWRVDGGEGTRVAELFTEDATLSTPHFTLTGRPEIDTWFTERADLTKRLSRHFWTNLRVTSDGDGRFNVQAYAMTIVGVPPAPAAGATVAMGVSHDVVVIEEGRPLFASRRLDLTFQGRLEAPAA
jgi:ketosteroid isomerase-like protein